MTDANNLKSANKQEYSRQTTSLKNDMESLVGASNSEPIEPKIIHNTNTTLSGKRQYTEEDKKFIVDGNNSLDEIMVIYGFESKKAASNKRSYFRTELIWGKNKATPEVSNESRSIKKGATRKYMDEERFLLPKKKFL